MKLLKDSADVLPKLKKLAVSDRAIFEKGMKAFVSFIQSYAKHECNLIFRIKDLDFAAVARGFGLLKLPKMPELRGKSFPDFIPENIDTNSIRYRDKNREKQRQKMLAKQQQERQQNEGKKKFVKNKPWSKQKTKRDKRKKQADKRKQDEVEPEDEDVDEVLNEYFASVFTKEKDMVDGECFSDWRSVAGGVAQGSVLGPLNDFEENGSDMEDENIDELLNDTRLLKKLKRECKTKELIVDFRKKGGQHIPIYINGAEVDSVKFLG
eukprot:g47767.t1